jgi:hypothetical protein
MKRLLFLVLALAASVPAQAAPVEGTQVMYVGGSVAGLPAGTMGTLDTQRADVLVFQHAGGRLEIPYNSIQSFQYSQRLARRMGVLPTIAVGLVKRRQRRHFVEVAFRGAEGSAQAVVLEVSKEMAQPVTAVLVARSPKPCKGPGAIEESPAPCRVTHVSIYTE